MSIYGCFVHGVHKGQSRFRLAVYLWLIFFVISLVAVMPLISIVGKSLGHFIPGQPIAMPFELNVAEIFLNHQEILAPYLSLLLTMGVILAIFFTFLNAGLFGRTLSEERINLKSFLLDGTHFFWRFFLSGLAFLPFLIVLLVIYRALVSPLNIWSEKAVTEWPVIISSNLRLVVFLLLWTIFRMSLDLVRIIMVKEESGLISAVRAASGFLKKHFWKFWGLFLLLGAVYLLGSLVFFLTGKLFSNQNWGGVIMLILLSQAYILFRLLTRIIFISAEGCYYLTSKQVEQFNEVK
ncbi:MAG: hypothetical protein ACPLRX_07230 [Candidatus Saccharicenans sp.]